MNLEWHELICETDDPDYPKSEDQLLFHIYETGRTFLGYFDLEDKVFFSSHLGSFYSDGDAEEFFSSPVVPKGLRIAWAYLDMDQASFPLFDKLEEAVRENWNDKLKHFVD